jgi:hypothetical protein
MRLRARFNTERSYEIYAMDCDKSITEKHLWDWWDKSPQDAADLTRKKGVCLFSNRKMSRTIQIT